MHSLYSVSFAQESTNVVEAPVQPSELAVLKSFDYVENMYMFDWYFKLQDEYAEIQQEKNLIIRTYFNAKNLSELFNLASTHGKDEAELKKMQTLLKNPFVIKIHKAIFYSLDEMLLKSFKSYKNRSSNFKAERLKQIVEIDKHIHFSKTKIAIHELFNNEINREGLDKKRKDFVKLLYFKTQFLSDSEINEYVRMLKQKSFKKLYDDIKITYLAYLQKIVVNIKQFNN
jgi:hypothetical protein